MKLLFLSLPPKSSVETLPPRVVVFRGALGLPKVMREGPQAELNALLRGGTEQSPFSTQLLRILQEGSCLQPRKQTPDTDQPWP